MQKVASPSQGARGATFLKSQIPATGLTEFWYPAIRDWEVRAGRRHPVELTLLGRRLVLFKDANGTVSALDATCPHRGGDLAAGVCHVKGTVSCPYHAWTFDGSGECVAVLSEGPESRIPGQEGARARSYPTETKKSVVFIWMGDGPATPIEDSIPPEFFQEKSQIETTVIHWKCNWRPALENRGDSHATYLHRNALRVLILSSRRAYSVMQSSRSERKTRASANGTIRVHSNGLRDFKDEKDAPAGGAASQPAKLPGIYARWQQERDFGRQMHETYPALNGYVWPRPWRIAVATLMGTIRKQTPHSALITDPSWRDMRLPGIIRTDNGAYIYTRYPVPIDEKNTQMWYFHTRYPRNSIQATYYRLAYRFFYTWWYNRNFSRQDGRCVEGQNYEAPEYLSGTDAGMLVFRKLTAQVAAKSASVANESPVSAVASESSVSAS